MIPFLQKGRSQGNILGNLPSSTPSPGQRSPYIDVLGIFPSDLGCIDASSIHVHGRKIRTRFSSVASGCWSCSVSSTIRSPLGLRQGLNIRLYAHMTDTYGGPSTDDRVSPLLASSHAGLPPAYIQVMHLDVLNDDGIAYERALRESGVATKLIA